MKGSKIASGIGWIFAERLSAQIVMFLVSIVLARLLAPQDYGILALVNVFVTVADALVIGGFGSALVQKKDSNNEDFNSIFWLSIGIAVVLYILLYLGSPYIAYFYSNQKLVMVTRVLGIRLIFSAINSIQQTYIQKYMLFKKMFVVSAASAVMSGIVGITAALAGADVWALVFQQLTYILSSTVLLFFNIEWKPKLECSVKSIKLMWGYGSRVFIATAVDTIKDNIRSLVVGKVFSETDLAFYNQGKKFPQVLVGEIVNSVGKVLFPAFSEQQDDRCKNKELMRISIRISSFIVLPLVFGMIGVADAFIEVVLTSKWLPCVPFLRILSLVYITRSLGTIMKNALLAIGKSGIALFHEVVTSIMTVILIMVAAFVFHSVEWVAWSYVIIMVVGTVIFSYFVIREYKYTVAEIFRDYVPSLALSLLMMSCVYMIGFVPITMLVRFILQVVAGILIYFCVAKALHMQEYEMVMRMVKKIASNKR